MGLLPHQLADFVRFMRKVTIDPLPGGCWEWTGNCQDGRYGHFSIGGDAVKAHRWLYEALVEEIPDGLILRHSCDNPKCVCPSHLTTGTNADNSRDMIDRGRNADRRGEKHPFARVGEYEVKEIRRLCAIGMTQARVAEFFGMSRQQVGKIVRRDNWSHVA